MIMKWKFLNIPLGASAPYGNHQKQDALGVLDLIGGFFGSLMDSANVSATNEANSWMNIATNNTNMAINQNNLDWARQQYERERAENRYLVDQAYQRSLADRDNDRAYNSAKAQAERLLAAGINPALAMGSGALGHAGAGGSTVNSVGSPAHANQPQSIPAQTGIPMQAYTGFGQGIRDSLRLGIESMAQQSESAKINQDIAYSLHKMEMEYFEYLDQHAKSTADTNYVKALQDNMIKEFALEKDKFQKQVDWQNFQQYVQQYQLAQRDTELELQKMATQSGIALNAAQAKNLMQLIQESIQRVDSMKNADTLNQNQFWHEVQQDFFNRKSTLIQLGFNEDKLNSEIFRNYFTGAIDAVGTGLGVYLGLRSGGKYVKSPPPPNGMPSINIPNYKYNY